MEIGAASILKKQAGEFLLDHCPLEPRHTGLIDVPQQSCLPQEPPADPILLADCYTLGKNDFPCASIPHTVACRLISLASSINKGVK